MAPITTNRTIFLAALMFTLSLVAFSAITQVKAQEDDEENGQDIENNQEIEQDIECENGAGCDAEASNTYIICEEGSTCVFKEDPTTFPVYT